MMKITMENIGGITKHATFNLKKGINVVKAPNAIGKSSFIHGIQTIILPDNKLKEHTEFLNDFSLSGRVEIVTDGKTIYRTLRSGREGLDIVGDSFYPDGWKASLLSIAIPENEFLDLVLKGHPIDKFLEEFSDAKHYQKLINWCKDNHRELLIELNKHLETVTRLKAIQEQIEKNKKELEHLEKERVKLKPLMETLRKEKFDKKIEELGKKRGRRTSLYSRIESLKFQIKTKEKEIPRLEKEIERLDKEISQFHKKHPDVQKEIDKLWDTIVKLGKLKGDINDEIGTLELHLSHCEMGEGTLCTECGRPFTLQQRRKRLSDLKRKLTERRKELVSLRSQIEEAEIERNSLIEERDTVLTDIHRELKEKSGTLTQHERDIKDWKKELDEKLPEMKELDEKIKELEKSIDPRTRKTMQRISEIDGDIGKIESILKIYKDEIKGMSEAQKNVQKLQRKTEFLKISIPYLTERMKQLKDLVREKFNKRIMEVYNILGFKDFEKIEIDDMFRLRVRRKYKDRIKTQELNRLSTSERITIGVIVMLAGKEEYLSDFPFFILDEVTTAYDPKRFEKIIKYLQNHVPYVIVTALTPSGTLKIGYSI